MTERLHDQLAFDAREGEDLYDARAASLTTRARSRVRRARTMRAVGTGAVAAVLVGVAAVGVAWGGGRDGVTPAVSPSASPSASSSPSPTVEESDPRLATDALARTAAPRQRGVPLEGERQAALICPGPWPEPGSNAIVFDDCPAVWVGEGTVMEVFATITVDAVASELVIGWELVNMTESPLAFDGDSIAVGLVTDPDGTSTGASVSGPTMWDTSLWLTDTHRGAVLSGDGEETVVPAHQVRSGVVTIPVAAPAEGDEPDVAYLVANGSAEPWVVVQARLLPSDDWGPQDGFDAGAFMLETTTLPAWVEGAIVADDLLGAAQPRYAEDVDRGAAQAGLDCVMDPSLNPRVSETAPAAFSPICDAVWLTDDSPLLELQDMTFDYDAVSGDITVNWTVRNASGSRIQVDRESVAVVVEAGPSWQASSGVRFHETGSLIGSTLWASSSDRYGFVTRNSSAEELEPNQLFGGSTTIDGLSEEDLSGIRASLLVRIPARLDLDGAQELLLELPWQG